ncbi:hypothetical protein TNCV_1156831 [Trichonephila clavipes]|nr:hypothetical protein TNCV_1156831 [Trichonephila clavipes]
MQWIPSHCGIAGKENADCLAKKGTKIIQTSSNRVPFYNAKRIIKKYYRDNFWSKFNQKTKQKEWFRKLLNILKWPRDRGVAGFPIATGISKHLNTISYAQSPLCKLYDSNA